MQSMITRTVRALAARLVDTVGRPLKRLWRHHLDQVVASPGYAAAVAAVLAGCFGLMTPRDASTAVLAGLLGVSLRGTRVAGGAISPDHSSYDFD